MAENDISVGNLEMPKYAASPGIIADTPVTTEIKFANDSFDTKTINVMQEIAKNMPAKLDAIMKIWETKRANQLKNAQHRSGLDTEQRKQATEYFATQHKEGNLNPHVNRATNNVNDVAGALRLDNPVSFVRVIKPENPEWDLDGDGIPDDLQRGDIQ
tara:strand:- start:39 stop:512 length:474 start_codon:yes stop_codon:yes gene_type:complete